MNTTDYLKILGPVGWVGDIRDYFLPPAYAPEAPVQPENCLEILPDRPTPADICSGAHPHPPVYIVPKPPGAPPRPPLPLPPKWEPLPVPVQREPIQPPTYPVRRIKPDPSTPTPDRRGVTIQQSLSDRKFGCLLHVPISDACLVFDLCTGDFSSEELEEQQNNAFLKWLAGSVGIAPEVVDTVGEASSIIGNIADIAVIFLPPPYKVGAKVVGAITDKINLVFGLGNIVDLLSGSSSQSQNASGLSAIATVPKCIKYNECPTKEPVSTEVAKNFVSKSDGVDECFVPIRNFKSNEPDGVGYEPQLQIIFGNRPGETAKQITIPNPKLNLKAEDIINALAEGSGADGKDIYFGQVKVESDITTYGYIRHYASSSEEGKKLVTSLARLSNGNVVEKSLRASERTRDFKTGYYRADRAYVFDFKKDGSRSVCRRFNLR